MVGVFQRFDQLRLPVRSATVRRYAAVAVELGTTGETLRTWVHKDTAQAERCEAGTGQSPADELTRLRAENARLLKAEKEWQLERELLRRAAVYFAREAK